MTAAAPLREFVIRFVAGLTTPLFREKEVARLHKRSKYIYVC